MFRSIIVVLAALVAAVPGQGASRLRGKVRIDGSSTVFPITEAVAEEFNKEFPRVRVQIGISGTGGGFKKFFRKESDINNASREIQGKELELAKEKGADYLELAVAYDGISVVINRENTWARTMTTGQLKKIWQAGSKVKKWSDIDSKWPQTPLRLYGPGTDSGTFDYFTKVINGKSHSSRADYTKSEDDNVLVKGVTGDKNALAYFGYAYYRENIKKLNAVALSYKGGKGVLPSVETINNNSYKPLSRPIFIYVSKSSLKNPGVKEFIIYYLKTAGQLVNQVGYVALPEKKYKRLLKRFKKWASAE